MSSRLLRAAVQPGMCVLTTLLFGFDSACAAQKPCRAHCAACRATPAALLPTREAANLNSSLACLQELQPQSDRTTLTESLLSHRIK